MVARKQGIIMLNYANLNDVEFEHLCTDVMTKKLGTSLRRFASGRDGGIDLANTTFGHDIVVQVKHYTKSDVSSLISTLQKEIVKVNNLRPNQYYVCCSKELTAARITQIYNMFSTYMESDKNVITLLEIDDFLTAPKNIDILRKHYKLWLSSTGILETILTNDIFIDSEMLLANIENHVKFFVQTKVYDNSLDCLSKNRVLFITGDPGVGKTTTSKMLALYFSAQGFAIRYTTNGTDLSHLKQSLSQSKDKKELILLDDCFGQAYFNMKETQGSELLSLIRYIHLSPNKILLLNSRVTIYQEARVRTPELVSSFENKEYRVNIIDVNQMTPSEKAKIYYNHLYFNQVDSNIWLQIKTDKKYRDIITHKNYNPRIIEFISNPLRFADSQHQSYNDFVMDSLNNPSNVWKDEYERKLTPVDRIFVSTLYSLTETTAEYQYVQRIFNHRISTMPSVDVTINQFESSLLRLQDSFVKIVSKHGRKYLSMTNPSINDYLKVKIAPNAPEYQDIINHSVSVTQLQQLLPDAEFNQMMIEKATDGSLLN